jgi:class 3 adenylate cyclase
VTILFADLVGSTALGERLDPETVRMRMQEYFETIEAVVVRHRGVVETFAGDAVMAVFGIPRVREDDGLRAVRAAVEIRQAVAALPAGLDLHIGLNTGEVVTGQPGSRVLATGDAVNVAARLEEAAKPGEILLGETTYGLVRDAVTVDRLAPLTLKGKSEPVAAVRLVDLLPDVLPRADTPFVGRDEELADLEAAFASALANRRPVQLTVVGEAGIGKSRLVREFLARVGGQARSLSGRCLPYGDGITFWPVVELVTQAASLSGDETLESTRARIRALLGGEPDAGIVAERLTAIVAADEREAGVVERIWAIRRFVETLARERPLVLVLDDLQWAEPTFQELVRHLAHAHDAPLLLIGIARPDVLDVSDDVLFGRVVSVHPLPENETRDLVRQLETDQALSEELRARIAETSGGNPLFAEELVRTAAERGPRAPGMPATIQAVLAARIDTLAAPERLVLAAASVEGQVFHRGALEHLAGDVNRPVAALEQLELIRPERAAFADEVAFRFHHLLLRDVTYESISKAERAELHERFADWLESKAGARARDYDEILGYHLEAAHGYRVELGREADEVGGEAAERLAYAGLRAHARGDMSAAVSLLARALALLPPDSTLAPELGAKHDEALLETGALTPSRHSSTRCFWSWPLGHHWAAATRHGHVVLRCTGCGKERRPAKADRPFGDSDAKLAKLGGPFSGN